MATPNPEPEFVRELAEKYKCSLCTNLLNTPVLTECCGQHFCRDCLEKWITRKKATTCPHCRAENFNRIVSQPIINEIKELQVYCTNRKSGCKKILSYGTFPEHLNICPFEVVTCTNNCDIIARLLRKDLKQHCQEKCPNRIVNCSLCNEEGKHSLIVGDHTKWCPDVILECPNKCGEKVKRKDIKQHREQCPLEVVECPFKEAGCEIILPRKDLPDHEMTATQNHLRLTMSSMAIVRKENNELKQSHEELNQSHKELKESHEEQMLKLDTISSVVSKELSSLDTGSIAPQPIASIQTTLTSLTTMIRPDGKVHTVHISKELGVCREESERMHYICLPIASSPQLWIHPGFKVYLCAHFGNRFCIMLLKSKTHGYPDELSIQVQFKTEPPIAFELSKRDVKTDNVSVLFSDKIELEVQDKNNFYVNVSFKLL